MINLPVGITREHLLALVCVLVVVVIWVVFVKPCAKCKKHEKKVQARNAEIDDLTSSINSD